MKVFTMKFCINCKHFSPAKDDPEHQYARCSFFHVPSLVTGIHVRSGMSFCSVFRMAGEGNCGFDGKHYEEKEATNV